MNRVFLMGNLGKEPEIFASKRTGEEYAIFSMATNDYGKDKQTGAKKENTEWHRVICFGVLGKSVKSASEKGIAGKGARVLVEGRIQSSKRDVNGVTSHSVKIVAYNVDFIDKRRSEPQAGYFDQRGNDRFENEPYPNDDIPF